MQHFHFPLEASTRLRLHYARNASPRLRHVSEAFCVARSLAAYIAFLPARARQTRLARPPSLFSRSVVLRVLAPRGALAACSILVLQSLFLFVVFVSELVSEVINA